LSLVVVSDGPHGADRLALAARYACSRYQLCLAPWFFLSPCHLLPSPRRARAAPRHLPLPQLVYDPLYRLVLVVTRPLDDLPFLAGGGKYPLDPRGGALKTYGIGRELEYLVVP